MRKVMKNSKSYSLTSKDSCLDLMQQVLVYAKFGGATEASVSLSQEEGFSVDVRMKTVDTLAFHDTRSIGVTVYVGKRQGSASTTDLSEQALKAMVSHAYDIASVSAEDECFGLADKDLVTHHFPDLELYSQWHISPEEAINLAIECETQALSLDNRITNSDGVNVSTYNMGGGFADTYGRIGWVDTTRHAMSCALVATEGNKMQRDYEYTLSRSPKYLTSIDILAQSALERVIARLNGTKIKTQRVPVVFSSRLSSGLMGSFISAISGSNLYRKNSFLLNCLNQEIFPKFISIFEQPHLLQGLGSSPFDSEGVLTRENVFVEEGRVRQYALGSYSARKLGLKTTANSGGVFNLTVSATHQDLNDILKEMDTGLFVTELMGQGVNIVTGDYSRGASGFWVQNGKIQYPVEEITIAGNLKSMFKDIVAVGADINLNSATKCGSVLIREMMIAGG